MKSGIYKITNTINGKFYIGSSKNIEFRWNDHKQYLRGNYHVNPKLQNAWNKYGEDKFIFEILEETESSQEILFDRENYYLSTLKPYERTVGYNICPKAEGGDLITYNPNREQFIKKMILINGGENNGMYGKLHSIKSIDAMKQKAIGRYTLDWFISRYGTNEGLNEFKKRNEMLKNRKINYSYSNPIKGKKRGPMSEEIKKKISERKAKLKLVRPDLHKDILSNEYTLNQLSDKYGTSISTIKNEKRKLMK
jgi:group I intron endonuclease